MHHIDHLKHIFYPTTWHLIEQKFGQRYHIFFYLPKNCFILFYSVVILILLEPIQATYQ